ncbi:hypothetical protein HDU76_011766, partial [Blyttiomyces sp. JEL0837]
MSSRSPPSNTLSPAGSPKPSPSTAASRARSKSRDASSSSLTSSTAASRAKSPAGSPSAVRASRAKSPVPAVPPIPNGTTASATASPPMSRSKSRDPSARNSPISSPSLRSKSPASSLRTSRANRKDDTPAPALPPTPPQTTSTTTPGTAPIMMDPNFKLPTDLLKEVVVVTSRGTFIVKCQQEATVAWALEAATNEMMASPAMPSGSERNPLVAARTADGSVARDEEKIFTVCKENKILFAITADEVTNIPPAFQNAFNPTGV